MTLKSRELGELPITIVDDRYAKVELIPDAIRRQPMSRAERLRDNLPGILWRALCGGLPALLADFEEQRAIEQAEKAPRGRDHLIQVTRKEFRS